MTNFEKLEKAKQAVNGVVLGQEKVVDLLITALLANGHVLLESVPGSGKTQLAKTFAKVMDGIFRRIQFTPDVLPSDVTGIQFFNPKTEEFEMRIGPVMSNILLADEINRATPKTQSSLLEVMEEKQTTIDGETIHLPSPFIVIATQNPIESTQGTFPLPEAQLDRFLLKINMNYLTQSVEKEILQKYRVENPLDQLNENILSTQDVLQLQEEVKAVNVNEPVMEYLLSIVEKSRNHPDVEWGISTRGALALMKAAQAKAFIHGRNYVTPQDVKALVPYVFAHRLVLSMEASLYKTTDQVVESILNEIEVPVEIGAEK